MIEVLRRRQKHTRGILTGSPDFFAAWSLTAVILVFVATVIWPHQAVALSSAPNSSTWVTDGTVYAIVDNGTTVYIGGEFSYVGPNTGFGAPIIASTGSLAPTYPKVNGIVNVAVSDGSNGWYIGGDFTQVGNYERNRVAHILSDGTVDTAWNPNADAIVYTLAVSGTTVYVGGEFTSIGGQPRQYIAALDASGAATAWAPETNNTVWALAVSGATVYAGGDFTGIGGALRNFIAALDAAGSAIAWNPNADGSVYALAVNGATVYAGGVFTTIGGQLRQNIAALDATGSATSWNPNADAPVFALEVSGTTVYVAGDFFSIGGQSRNFIAALNATGTGTATSWNPNASNTVWALDVSGTIVYAGGDFTSIGGQARNHIAALNTTDNGTTSWNPNANDTVYAVAVSGTEVYVGGLFTSIGGQARNNLAALNATTGEATPWDPNANKPVYALAVIGTKLYAGGEFTTMGGSSRLRIARFTTTTGALDSYSRNFDNTINAIRVIGTNLYFGGDFTVISSNSLPYLASFDSSGTIRTTWRPNPSAPVLALAGSGNTVYAGGYFSSIGAQSSQPTRNFIAALDATDTGTATAWNPNASDAVWALDVSGTTVYAVGQFNYIGAQEEWPNRNYIAALNTTDNGTATSWDPNASDPVWALAASGNTVYAGGDFTTIGAQLPQPIRNHLAALNTTDNGTATSWDPDANNFTGDATVHALTLGPGRLHVGGYFSTIGNVSQPFLARFDGNTAVDFKSFTAKGSATHVSLSWETGAEVDNAGFRLWRSIVSNKGYKLITPHVIPAEGDGGNGAGYDHQDRNVRPGMTYYYRLEVLDSEGGSAFYETPAPVSATVGSIVLAFPKDGATIPEKMPPSLKWRNRGFDRFQIQFSGDASFASPATIPKSAVGKSGLQSDQWITEDAYRPTSKEWRTITNLVKKGSPLYWRVYGENDAGNGLTSVGSRIIIK
jgi:trimeric autotransporter adhesin